MNDNLILLNLFPPVPHTPSQFEKREATPLSAEFEAFRKCSADLIRKIQDPELLAWELYSDNILSQTAIDEVSVVELSTMQRKTKLLNAVRLQIVFDPTKFQNFLQVLRKQPSLEGVAEKLKTTYESNLQEDYREMKLKGVSHSKFYIFSYFYTELIIR